MAFIYITTNQTTQVEVDFGDDLIVIDGVNITSNTNGIANENSGINDGMTFTIRGGVYGSTGINLWSNSTENNDTQVYIAKGAHVHGTLDGITIRQGDDNVVINHGEISAQQAGIYFQGGEATVHNHGTISSFGSSAQGAIIFNSSTDGTNIREVTNTGIIMGAPQSTASALYATITNVSGAEFHLDNSGSIIGLDAVAVYSSATESFFDNSGEIVGQVRLAGTSDFQNSGEIRGDVFLSGATEAINSGLINGDMTLSSSSDFYYGIGDGVVTGDLLLGSGDDTAILGNLGGDVFGESGADTITGGAGADFIDGGNDNDRLFGRGGDDDVRGGLGSDFMSAGAGDDFMLGDDGADRMFGGGGEDTLQGGRDLDTIRGGDGDDEINGGRSADVLRGGAGADTFLYQFRQDSTVNLSDTIQDFQVGVDVIDISGIAGQFAFVGSAAFSGSGNEVRYEIGGNGKTFVEVDTDANGTADMRILLTAVGVLTEDDFVL